PLRAPGSEGALSPGFREFFYIGPSLAPAVAFAGAGDTAIARGLLSDEIGNTMRTTRPGGIEEAVVGFAVVAFLENDPRQASRLRTSLSQITNPRPSGLRRWLYPSSGLTESPRPGSLDPR